MRVVLDANILVSGLISSKGAPATILRRWQEGAFDVVASPETLDEIDRVLHYPQLQKRFHLDEDRVQRFLQLLRRQVILVKPEQRLTVVQADPTDNRCLECALAAEATIVVSGDQHLLALGKYEAIQILSPAGFLALLQLEG